MLRDDLENGGVRMDIRRFFLSTGYGFCHCIKDVLESAGQRGWILTRTLARR